MDAEEEEETFFMNIVHEEEEDERKGSASGEEKENMTYLSNEEKYWEWMASRDGKERGELSSRERDAECIW
jgi:hypothetical protein